MPAPPRPLALALLVAGLAARAACAGFQPPAQCPLEQFRTGQPRPLRWSACPRACTCAPTDVQLWCPGPAPPQLADADADYLQIMVVEGVEVAPLQAHHLRCLDHLLSLTLSNGRIGEIAEDAFRDLVFLRHLDLSNNEIVNIPVDLLASNKNLRFLVLDGNPIHVPSSDPLLRSTSLGSLSMEGCGITYVKSQTFAGTPELYEILMEDNALTEFPREAVSHLKRLCSIRVDVLIEDVATHAEDAKAPSDAPLRLLDFDMKQILIISGVALVMALVLVGVYKVCSSIVCPCRRKQEVVLRDSHPSNHAHGGGWTQAPGPIYETINDRQMVDGRGGYHIVDQNDLHLPTRGYSGYVYNGVEFASRSRRETYSYVENCLYTPVHNYRRPRDRLPPPPPYETVARTRLLSRKDSVATSTSDLHASALSDSDNA